MRVRIENTNRFNHIKDGLMSSVRTCVYEPVRHRTSPYTATRSIRFETLVKYRRY
jgi:hypothetical protein